MDRRSRFVKKPYIFIIIMLASVALLSGCNEVDTITKALTKKFTKKPNKFTPRDGITIRQTSLYQAANPNSQVLRKLPAEETLHLNDKTGEFYRVRAGDGVEGYVEQKAIGGEDIVEKIRKLRLSIESVPVQAEGVTKTKAYFRLEPGRQHEVLEVLPPGKKFELYERVVTPRQSNPQSVRGKPGQAESEPSHSEDMGEVKKDVWYKVKIEDGRVGYIFTTNIQLTPPEGLAKKVPFMRIMAWRPVSTTDDKDVGAVTNYVTAFTPFDKDPGCDFTRLYFFAWLPKFRERRSLWVLSVNGVLPITPYHAEGKPGFSVRQLHPTKKDKLILASYVFVKGTMKKVQEEEIPNPAEMH